MITQAKKEWTGKLKLLWKQAFGDKDAYIDFYFKNRFREDNMLVYLSPEEEVLAMASLLPARLWEEESHRPVKKKAYYIYAVATAPASQGQGISSKLLDAIHERLRNENALGILVPGEKSLIGFYKNRGFYEGPGILKSCLWQRDVLEAAQLSKPEISFNPLSPLEYKQQRDAFYGTKGYIEWDLEAITYAVQENKFNGGFCYGFSAGQEGIGAILGYQDKRQLILVESTLSLENLNAYGDRILQSLDCDRMVTNGIFTMSTWSHYKEGYFNLPLA